MKRAIILLLLTFAAVSNAFAQPTQRQKMIHMAAVRIAGQIGIGGSDKDAFISLYQNYKKESGEILKIQPESYDDVEKAAETRILSDFDKSERLLHLRESYYSKFRKILSPTQIQKMYDLERAAISHSD